MTLLNWCLFDLWTHICTQIRTLRPQLPRVQPSSNYQWSTITSYQNRCSFDLWPRICTQIRTLRPRLPKVQPSFNYQWSTITSYQNRCSFDPDANKHTHTHKLFFSYDPPYSRGNKRFFHLICISKTEKGFIIRYKIINLNPLQCTEKRIYVWKTTSTIAFISLPLEIHLRWNERNVLVYPSRFFFYFSLRNEKSMKLFT